MVRFGLCCIFVEEPVKFRTVTAKTLLSLPQEERLEKIGDICLGNAKSLLESLRIVRRLGIGAFRILSSLFPRYTHPEAGYTLAAIPHGDEIKTVLNQVNRYRRAHGIRLSFHPDQFVVLNSPDTDVVRRSVLELDYHGMLAEIAGADVINIHAGGAYGDKGASLARFARNLALLSPPARKRITLENDDCLYAPGDLLPCCRDLGVPLVYDVHHHRCHPDGLSEEAVTEQAMATWKPRRVEPYFHLSSPKHGWEGRDPKPHADYIDPRDIPAAWHDIGLFTLDVEAKAKEKAVLRLMTQWSSR